MPRELIDQTYIYSQLQKETTTIYEYVSLYAGGSHSKHTLINYFSLIKFVFTGVYCCFQCIVLAISH